MDKRNITKTPLLFYEKLYEIKIEFLMILFQSE